MNGVLIIDKPGGMTSHDVVQQVRRLLGTSRVGHLGTLDPMATGVLPLCVGAATRIARFFPSFPKEYAGEIHFGFSTTTYDREGTATSTERPFVFTQSEVAASMLELTGSLNQTPPPFSAKKIGGVPSYKLARQGQVVEHAPVAVEVHRFEVVDFDPPLVRFRVICSGGTYVRSLAHDLGERLGCGAHLSALRRLQSGDFRIDDAVALCDAQVSNVVAMEGLLPGWPCLVISEEQETRVGHGNSVPAPGLSGLTRIFNKKGEFLAVAAIENGLAHPRVVLTSKA